MSAAWEKQPDESEPAFQAFRTYCEMGAGRSARKVADRLGKNVSLMFRWSARHSWVRRAAAWDARASGASSAGALGRLESIETQVRALGLPAAELLRRAEAEPDLLQGMSVENLLSEAQAATRHLGQLARLEAARKRGGAPRADLGPILAVVVLLILGPDMARLDVLEALQTASQHELPIREAVALAYAVGLEEGGGLEASTDGGTNEEIQSLQASLAQAQEMWATAIEQQRIALRSIAASVWYGFDDACQQVLALPGSRLIADTFGQDLVEGLKLGRLQRTDADAQAQERFRKIFVSGWPRWEKDSATRASKPPKGGAQIGP